MNIRNNKRIKFYLIYTAVFLLCCAVAFYYFYSNGKTLIYDKDGWHQYLKVLIYYSNYLKELFTNIFVNHIFELPEWSFSIGEGAGILATFHCYLIGDPIAFLSVFFNENNMYIFYNFSVILRLYLAGIAFAEYCFFRKKDNIFAVLGGSITYVFCFWCLFNSVRHLHFLNPMIILPFLIMSVDRVIDDNKCIMFTLMVFAMSIINFYFFSIFVMIVVVYVAIRLLVKYKTDVKAILKKIGTLFVYSAAGVLMGAVIIMPMLFAFTDDFRLSVETELHLLYPLKFYFKLPSMFLSTSREYWLCMGYASPVLLSFFSLFKRRKNNWLLFVLTVVSVFFILTPVFGQATNGFRYVTNKWCFSLALLYSYILVNEWEHIRENRLFVSALYLIVLGGCLVLSRGYNITIPLILGAAFMVIVWFDKNNSKVLNSLCVLLICICVCFNAFWLYSPYGNDYLAVATTVEDDANIFNMGESAMIYNHKEEFTDEFFRYSGSNLTLNSSLLFGNHSTDLYWSLTNKYVSRYRNDVGLTEYSLSDYFEYDRRSSFYTLANVKYYINDTGSTQNVPYGFEFYKTIEDYDIYINKASLPFGYTYDTYVLYDDWSKLNAVEKEEVLWKSVVLDNEDLDSKNISLESSKDVKFEIVTNDGVNFDGNNFVVSDPDATITIYPEEVTNAELFLLINGLDYTDGKSWMQNPLTNTNIGITTSLGNGGGVHYASEDDKYQHGRDTFAVYLGYVQEQPEQYITLTFADEGTYSVESISMMSLKMDDYESSMEKLKKDTLENVLFESDKVSGTIDLDSGKYLVVSIPCAKGWKAYIDGQETDIINANGAYIGVFVPSGSHTVEYRYETPYLRLGLTVSIVSIIGFASFVIYKRKKLKA